MIMFKNCVTFLKKAKSDIVIYFSYFYSNSSHTLDPRRYGHLEYVDILDFVNPVKLVASTWKRRCFVNSATENHVYCVLPWS